MFCISRMAKPSALLFTILSRTQGLGENPILKREFASATRMAINNLYAKIMPLGDPTTSVSPVLDEWLKEVGTVKSFALQSLLKQLRSRRRYTHALEVSEWMSNNGLDKFSLGDRAVQLDLIGRVRGLESAENYFKSLDDQYKVDKTYGALLNCYVREGQLEKSLCHLHKMKELGFASSPLSYNGIMGLYVNTCQLDKVPDVLSEMKENGILPNIFSYRICMHSYGGLGDIDSVEKILEEMQRQPHITMDWLTYATVASVYIQAGLKEKAVIHLRKCEENFKGNAVGYNHLISLYGKLRNKGEMMRLWGLAKAKLKKLGNMDYINMMGCLVKLGEFEETEKLLKEWEASCQSYDFRVPNTLLIGYCQNGFLEKAEVMLKEIISKGKAPTPNSFSIIAAGYVDQQNFTKGFEFMKAALRSHQQNKGWRLKPMLISSILSWLGDNGNVEDVEDFVRLLEAKVPRNREMYHALIKAYKRGGKAVDILLQEMKLNDINEDEETKRIIGITEHH